MGANRGRRGGLHRQRLAERECDRRAPGGSAAKHRREAREREEAELLGQEEVLAQERKARTRLFRLVRQGLIGARPVRHDGTERKCGALPLEGQLRALGVREHVCNEAQRSLRPVDEEAGADAAHGLGERVSFGRDQIEPQRVRSINARILDAPRPDTQLTHRAEPTRTGALRRNLGAGRNPAPRLLRGQLQDRGGREGAQQVRRDDIGERALSLGFELAHAIDAGRSEVEEAFARALERSVGRRLRQRTGESRQHRREPLGRCREVTHVGVGEACHRAT